MNEPKKTSSKLIRVGMAVCLLSLTGCESCLNQNNVAPADVGEDVTDDVDPGPDVTNDVAPDADAGGPPAPVTMSADSSLFIGAYQKVEVEIAEGQSFAFDDLDFRVSDPDGGKVSMSRDERFDPQNPTVMLLGGWRAGTYDLEALHQGTVVGTFQYDLTGQRAYQDEGPPIWVTGDTVSAYGYTSSAWGNEGGTTNPQNVATKEQTGDRKLYFFFPTFDDVDYGGSMRVQNRIQHFRDSVLNGRNGGKSVKAYFDEVSGGDLDIQAEFYGPVPMNGDIQSYVNKGWFTNLIPQVASQALSTDFDGDGQTPDLDLRDADTIVVVPPTKYFDEECTETNGGTEICDGLDNDCDGAIDALDDEIDQCEEEPTCGDGVVDANSDIDGDGNPDRDEECDDGNDEHWDSCNPECEDNPKQYAWPTASIGDMATTIKVNDGENVSVGGIKFGADWEDFHPTRETYETMAHEFGHNLGLVDLYGDDYARTLGNYNLMDYEATFTHFSISQRMMLGWVDSSEISTFNPATSTTQEVVLRPAETLSAPGNDKLGAEIRLADGWNYYWEYRLGQSMQIADQSAPIPQSSPGFVMGTDHMSTPKNAGQKRRRLAKVPQGPDSADFTLDPGEVFLQFDPATSQDLRVQVLDADSTQARLEITYDTLVPDPSIREWPSDLGRWKSPDIEVVNAKNEPGSDGEDEWNNTPWAGHDNEIVATIRNNGTQDAPGVTARFYSQKFNAGEELPKTLLGTVTEDVPANSTTEFRLDGNDAWVPRGKRHHCIKVEIDIYANPTSATPEATQMNNFAQSNYSKYWSKSSSPAERMVGSLTVNNPTDERTVVGVMVDQSHEHFRTYVEHRWVTLDPGQSQDIQVMYEYARDLETQLQERVEYFPTNQVTLTGVVVPNRHPEQIDWANPDVMGGASVEVRAGFETDLMFEQLPAAGDDQGVITGFVEQTRNQQAVTEGEALVRIKHQNQADTYRRATLDSNGRFEMQDVNVRGWTQIDGEYLGRFPNAPSDNVAVTP